jgi:hypothetical protein
MRLGRRSTARNPYRFAFSGLPNVWLIGVDLHRCPACQTAVPAITCMGRLHRLIAAILVERPGARTGTEMRFLRKAAGLSPRERAALLAMDSLALAEVERGDELGQRIVMRFVGRRWREVGATAPA